MLILTIWYLYKNQSLGCYYRWDNPSMSFIYIYISKLANEKPIINQVVVNNFRINL
jgi:hypothetical protein